MKITLLTVGKTTSAEVKSICNDYENRLKRYTKFESVVIDNAQIRLHEALKIKQREGELILKKINPGDHVVLLDERGKEYTSQQFAVWIGGLQNQSLKNICFVVGGAFGFSEEVYQRANATFSLSKMTCNHQLIRAVFCEQMYRAFTILNNEPYHHD